MSNQHVMTTVNTLVPTRFLDSFEGFFLRATMSCHDDQDGFTYIFSHEELPGIVSFLNRDHLLSVIEAGEASGSPAALALLPHLRELARSDQDGWPPELDIGSLQDENGQWLTEDHVSFLSAIVDRNPDELPFVEIQFAQASDKLRPGSVGGGAVLITPGKVESMDSNSWIKERRSALENPAALIPRQGLHPIP